MSEAFIIDGVRTPIGRYAGALSSVRTDDLAALPVRKLVERHPELGTAIDELVLGCANQAGEDNRNVARMAVLLSGLPVEVPGITLNRLCGSGLDAVGHAARLVKSGEADLVIAGGVESMSRAPYVQGKSETPFARGLELYDTTIGWRFVNRLIERQYGIDSMPETAENLAAEHSISRADQDSFALRSQARALAAQANGRLAREIVPVEIPSRNGVVTIDKDEHPRESSLEKLAKLPTPFREGGSITAGNASGVNDGAAALLIASARAVERYGLTPLARIAGMATAGVAPRIMGIGPVPATAKLLGRHGLTLADLDLIELNEAFAAQA
ncbi:MAG TPA: acetyl-CoA C-acyltransferase, partial [Magnetospirillaceae bacterium]|nr:acetyl-CoA C-acyltransferase [Magnetospirillaceae bacterium]